MIMRRNDIAKAMRFGLVGMTNAIVYAAFTAIAVNGFAVEPVLSSVIGYLAALLWAFVAHKYFTFRSDGKAQTEMFRFAIVYGLGLVTSIVAMYVATNVFGLSYIVGIVASIILVPFLTLIVLDRWVFTKQRVQRT